MNPMERIAALASGQTVPEPTTANEPPAPVVEKITLNCKACGANAVFPATHLPPEACPTCKTPWNQAAPVAEPEKPKAIRTRRPPRTEPAKTEPAATTPTMAATGPTDMDAKVQAFIKAKNLNEAVFTEVGTGVVVTHGFTVWADKDGQRVPTYGWFEPTDTPESFRHVLDHARKNDFTVGVDAVRVAITDPTVPAWHGEVIATTKAPTGSVWVLRGAKVRLGAKVSASGRLVWAVLGVAS